MEKFRQRSSHAVGLFLSLLKALLKESVLLLLELAVTSVILMKEEQGEKAGLKAEVQEEEEQSGQGGLKLSSRLASR